MMKIELNRAFKGINLVSVGHYEGKVVDLLESEYIVHLMLQSC